MFKNKYWFIFEVLKIIYLVKIFWKINNLENYLESGDVCISIDSSITDYQYLPLNGYLLWFVWIWMPHLFLNKRSLFGLTGKGPWGRITHSEYVIRRYDCIEDRCWRPGICESDRMTCRFTLHRVATVLSSPYVMVNPIRIVDIRIARTSL